MALFLSLSNQMCKMLKVPLERITDADGNNPGVQPISTNANRVSWQGQVIQLSGRQWQPYDDGSWLVVFMESHSRYCMIIHYPRKPDWETLQQDFYRHWKLHAIGWLRSNGFIQNDDDGMQILDNIEYYFEQTKVTSFRNLDRSIGAHIAEIQYYLHSLFDDHKPCYFDSEEAWELSMFINQQPRKINGLRSKKHQFIPVERFIDDALYRFASGISADDFPDVKPGSFPSPYPQKPVLKALE
ncbi:amino acid adenylation [Shewanella sp. D64]|uniref:amino acid adenylation n=1 Tax=unclassified Shewanella TaxID=196818 RepID=UPI0022BA29BA|nr:MULTISPECIES: amino acid adenylation [unclassified Shewanella]MEC4726814.1 amino acid adenylation [Shewanella sp. D64]MEC4739074.1 amino acid adenylation [Shewanella sp. E94]WBJ95930.1 amino acid adenylation [Shewanella sp. MTB7]